MSIAPPLCCVVLAIVSVSASGADVYRCIDRNGNVVFSGTSCGSNAEKVDVVDSSEGLTPIAGNGLSEEERVILARSLAKKEPDPSRIARPPRESPKLSPSTTPTRPSRY